MDIINDVVGYCYGPVTVNTVLKQDDYIVLTVQGANLRSHHAIYKKCIFQQVDNCIVGERLLMVEEIGVDDILKLQNHGCIKVLSGITANIDNLIKQWRKNGFHFYLHHTENINNEYLVVAEDLVFD